MSCWWTIKSKRRQAVCWRSSVLAGRAPTHLTSSSASKICSVPRLSLDDVAGSVSAFRYIVLLYVIITLCRKPKNARSKRALQAREAKEVEDPRVAIFVKGTHAGEKVTAVMKELVRFNSVYAFVVVI